LDQLLPVGPLDFTIHLLSFVAPALAVALLVGLAARLLLPRAVARPPWWAGFAINAAVGVAVLLAGLWAFGRDGKMATYLALVLAEATSQWLSGRAWRT
jgi:hypothetical protein